jgi:hypothetical protein
MQNSIHFYTKYLISGAMPKIAQGKERLLCCVFKIQLLYVLWMSEKKYNITSVALTETFRYLELCSTCLKEGLGRSKPATNSRTSTLTLWGLRVLHGTSLYGITAMMA